jgi:hypothetical protein
MTFLEDGQAVRAPSLSDGSARLESLALASGLRQDGILHRSTKGDDVAATKIVFLAFAKEDEGTKNLFLGQRLNTNAPFEWTNMSVKEPYTTEWKERVRTRIRRSNGVIALISSHTASGDGELWEITCAVEENKPLIGILIDDGYRTKPPEIGSAPCVPWTWKNVEDFISGL